MSEFYNILSKGGKSAFQKLVKTLENYLENLVWGKQLVKYSICISPFTRNKIKEANFKFIHKLYLTSVKMNKISNNISSKWYKIIAHAHVLGLSSFWRSVHAFTQSTLGKKIKFKNWYLLNDMQDLLLDKKKSRILITITYFDKKRWFPSTLQCFWSKLQNSYHWRD